MSPAPLHLKKRHFIVASSMAVPNRLSIAVLACAFVLAVTMQMVWPAAMTMKPIFAPTMTAAGTSEQSDKPVAPCKAFSPVCIDHIGCVTAIAVPTSPTAMGVPVQWRLVRYSPAVSHFTGLSIEPELSPPILAA